MFHYSKVTLVAIALAAVSSGAYADWGAESGVAAIAKAKVSLTQAALIAEQHVNGKSVKAEFDHSVRRGWIYDVEVVSGIKVFDVKVDAQSGKVLSSREDRDD